MVSLIFCKQQILLREIDQILNDDVNTTTLLICATQNTQANTFSSSFYYANIQTYG